MSQICSRNSSSAHEGQEQGALVFRRMVEGGIRGAKTQKTLQRCEQASGRCWSVILNDGREVDITRLEGRNN
jgi:hypothetical protein